MLKYFSLPKVKAQFSIVLTSNYDLIKALGLVILIVHGASLCFTSVSSLLVFDFCSSAIVVTTCCASLFMDGWKKSNMGGTLLPLGKSIGGVPCRLLCRSMFSKNCGSGKSLAS